MAPGAMALALLGAVVANATASLVGGGRLVGGPRASLSLLTAALVAALVDRLGPVDAAATWAILALVATGLIAAGLLQIAFGLLKLGTIVKFTPYPVRLGLASGIGLLLVVSSLPVALGHGFGSPWIAIGGSVQTAAAGVGAMALAVTWVATRARSRFPPLLLGLASAALLHAALSHTGLGDSLSSTIGVPVLPDGWFASLADAMPRLSNRITPTLLGLVGSYALTVAVICSLDTLLATSIIDGRLRNGRDANRELMAQGMANVATALIGGQPASPSVPRSLALVLPQPERRHVVLAYAAMAMVILLLAPNLLALLPTSAVGGVLLAQGLQMVSTSLWRTPMEVWSQREKSAAWDAGQRRMLLANWAVALAVALNAVLMGIGPAVLIGASFAVLLFLRANMRDVVRRTWTGETRRSLKMRTPVLMEALRREGRRIALLELEGSLFFGTADALRLKLEALAPTVDVIILDLHQINEIDVTAARILVETSEDWTRGAKRLVFAEWALHDPRRRVIEAVASSDNMARLHFTDNTDMALEQAETLLIERLQLQADRTQVLDLGDTMIARGLESEELSVLRGLAEKVGFDAGQVMFRQNDPGDALYISLKGEIGLRLPGSNRRLASFAPGVTLGEMAVLTHGRRSAEAVAESDVLALRLSVEAFDRLRSEHPALAAKLLGNLALHLADRVRILTGDLAHWVSRAAAGTGTVGAEPDTSRKATEETVD